MKDVQIFLIDILILLSLELGVIKEDYLKAWILQSRTFTEKALITFKDSTSRFIENRMKQQPNFKKKKLKELVEEHKNEEEDDL